ncbi:MAG: VCBS repeat-containing protein [Bacteroidetes bacterium]|nr:VCBS repeat-containing protein [Bacteroidota bacterium]
MKWARTRLVLAPDKSRIWGLLWMLLLLLAGCSASRIASDSPLAYPPSYSQEIYGVEVINRDGIQLDHPFHGGFNLPRPQLVDIDGDQDLDLFLQELTGQIKFFENTGMPTAPSFTWRSDHYLDLDVGEWYRFVDLDQDGDYDLIGETIFSYVRFFRNEGTPASASFAAPLDSLRDANGVPLFIDRQNIPTFVDLDCDGHLDLLIGRVSGTVLHYESVGSDASGLPRFQLVTDRFEDIEILGMFATLHGANALAFHDIDRDGDQDLFWGDFFEAGILLIENTGTCQEPNLRNEPVAYPPDDPIKTSGYNSVQFADVDGDGVFELLFGVLGGAFNPSSSAVNNLYLMDPTDERLMLTTPTLLSGIDVGADSYPVFADLDGDGDQDLLISNKISPQDHTTATIHYYENTSDDSQIRWTQRDPLEIGGNYNLAPALADLDADGDLDMLLGTWNSGSLYYRNDGTAETPHFVLDESKTVTLTRGSNSTPTFVDIDGDGDLDLFIGESSGDLNFYLNNGTPEQPQFDLISDKFEGIDVGRRSVPRFLDIDGDGDQDLILGREAGGVLLYLNEGTTKLPLFVESGTLPAPFPILAVPAFVDMDLDGDMDLFSGGLGGGLSFFINTQY